MARDFFSIFVVSILDSYVLHYLLKLLAYYNLLFFYYYVTRGQ
jgi:hypothetical protein